MRSATGRIVRRGGWVERHPGPIFIGPAIAVLVLMLAFPFGYTAYLSLFDWFVVAGPPRFAGFKNYFELVQDPRFLNALINTFEYTLLSVAGEIIFGLALALLMNRSFYGRGIMRTLFLLPMAATPVAIALVWLLMFDPAIGVLNYLLSLIGLPPSVWVNDPTLAIPALALVDLWQWTPLVLLILLGGLASLPVEPYEAAKIDGATSIQTFMYITLPLLRPYIIVAALFRGIDALKTFDTIYVITRGGPAFASETLNLYIYSSAFEYLKMGYSSAMLVVFFLIVLILSMVLILVRRRAV